jgi:hypothetical protein
MGILPPTVHRLLDYVAVIVFALAPTLFHLKGNTMMLAYALAVIHLIVTLATQFPGSARRPLPYSAHGIIELLVGLALVCVPLIRHWTFGAGKFYPAMGVVILIIWAITRYRDAVVPVTSAPVA